jgi:hypothetical protein
MQPDELDGFYSLKVLLSRNTTSFCPRSHLQALIGYKHSVRPLSPYLGQGRGCTTCNLCVKDDPLLIIYYSLS